MVNGYTEQFSIGVQRELSKGIFLEVSYVGNLGRHLLRQPNINQIPFALNAANQALPSAQRVNNSISTRTTVTTISLNTGAIPLRITMRCRRICPSARGMSFSPPAIPFRKLLGDSSGQGDNPENYLDRHYNYGPLSFDRRHAFVGTYVWSLPKLNGFNPLLRGALGSWRLNGIIRLQTGQYYTVTANTSIGTRRADYLGGSVIPPNGQTINSWINPAAFGPAPNSAFGDSGVGNVEGPGLQSYDISIAKIFPFRERYSLRFQMDAFNAFNVSNFNGLDTNRSDAAFGTLSSAYPPRNLQMQLKLTF